ALRVLSSWGVPEMIGGCWLTGFAALAAMPGLAKAPRAAATTAATPAPNAAPIATQRFLCLVCMPNPFRRLVLPRETSWFPVPEAQNGSFRDAYNSLARG